MVNIDGELYKIQIEHNRIQVQGKVPSLKSIDITAMPDEDFSIFDLGPAISGHIIIQAGNTIIGSDNYPNSCLIVNQKPGSYFEMTIKSQRARDTDPVDSGNTIHFFKDYIIKYE